MDKEFDLLALGEVLLRLSPPSNERLVRGDIFEKQVGGAELNVLSGVSLLGLRTGMISKLPDNELGAYAKNKIRFYGVSDDFLRYDSGRDARLGVYYYENGAHAGYIMYVTDAVQDRNDIEMLRENMVKSKGRNNFKNLFLYAPQGKADGIKIIPLSEVATKDDFFNIKKASAADLLDAHRIPFQLMGGKPENVGSLGDIEKVAKVFVRNELIPLQDRIREINGWLGQEVIRFKNYSLDTDNG